MSIRRIAMAGSAGFLALALAACGGGTGDNGDDTNGADDTNGTEDTAGGEEGGEDLGTITLGYIPSWTDGLSTAYLLDNLLTDIGYTVEHQTVEDAAILYAGLANGDIDMYASAWSERTHRQYMDEYEDQLEDLGYYYEGAVLNLSVPEYTDIDSIDELVGKGDEFGGESSVSNRCRSYRRDRERRDARLRARRRIRLVTSSTSTMLTELQNAVDAEEDIVVTLWSPFWANAEFPVKALEDPEGYFGEPENLHWLARDGFSEDFPEATELVGKIKLDDDEYGSLEDTVVNQFDDGEEPEAIEAWLEENQDLMDSMLG